MIAVPDSDALDGRDHGLGTGVDEKGRYYTWTDDDGVVRKHRD